MLRKRFGDDNGLILDHAVTKTQKIILSSFGLGDADIRKHAEKLKDLQEQKRRIEADAIMDAYLKSGKSLDEIMTFLNP